MMNKWFLSLRWLWMLGVVVLIAACGNEEAQRQAFIEFLQKSVIEKQGGFITVLTQEQREHFGDYASHYDIIVDFNRSMGEVVKPLNGIAREMTSTMKQNVDAEARKALMVKLNDQFQQINKKLDEELSRAETRLADLNQPDDLKAVYTQAFERTVRTPGRISREMVSLTAEMVTKANEVFDFIANNPDKIEIKGGRMIAKDRAVLTKLNAFQADLLAIVQKLQELKAQYDALAG
ncbi:MAG: DUF3053 domain-containing protein [Azoarcus sp.]|jgi:predicted nucleotidyltransferase|nr:DUF3053 domain-containing protein [Azoarcus sp.]